MGTANKSTVEGIQAAVKSARDLTPQVCSLDMYVCVGTVSEYTQLSAYARATLRAHNCVLGHQPQDQVSRGIQTF